MLHRWIFFNFLLHSDNELLISEMEKMAVTDLVSAIKSMENYSNQHGLQGFSLNIKPKDE